ncbi:HNH nuclease [uncultured Caudovirales phage]|uniref:HNH nuclease n=1 Tax=uncultured Caudovirales phage TaxID=2100421 RepID=A0A6J5SQS6_9CAUD|nr:HNH nuclease [uncultured Caudovirales phage]
MKTTHERFIQKIHKTSNPPCWLWSGHLNSDGYGSFRIGNRFLKAHRVAYELFKGEIGNNHVLHICDIPNCVNPDHLFLGTHSDNMQDMWNKGRHNYPKSEHHSKLTTEQVLEIKSLKGTCSGRSLAPKYKVNDQTIRNIWLGITWKTTYDYTNVHDSGEVLRPNQEAIQGSSDSILGRDIPDNTIRSTSSQNNMDRNT